jgi:hypothetical protein
MKRMSLAAASVVALLLLLTVGAQRASADTLTFQLTSDHCSGTGGCLPDGASAGTITITDVSGGVTVSVVLDPLYKFVHTGFDTDFGFNLAGNPTITFSNVSAGFTPNANPETAGSLHMDGAGFFEYGVTCSACGTGGSNPQTGPLSFKITGTGLSTGSFESNGTNYFAVDLLGQGNTGAVDASVPHVSVPDGGMTLMLLGGALLGLEALRRRVRA